MVDVSAIAGTVSALKGAMDISKAMIGLHDAQAMQTKVIELNSKILEAQSSAFSANDERTTLIERVRDLEKEVATLKAWETEKQRYKLSQVAPGLTAYTMKEGMENGEPPHHLCANCYQKGQKRVMQTEHRNPGHATVLVCHDCGSDLYLSGPMFPEHQAYRRRR